MTPVGLARRELTVSGRRIVFALDTPRAGESSAGDRRTIRDKPESPRRGRSFTRRRRLSFFKRKCSTRRIAPFTFSASMSTGFRSGFVRSRAEVGEGQLLAPVWFPV